MKRAVCIAAISIWFIASATAYDWPVEKKILTATFGESRKNHYHAGIDIAGGDQAIHPIEKGELVFYSEEADDPEDIPSGMGSFIVLEHQGGIRSIYAHIERGSIQKNKIAVEKPDVIGVTGDTGYSVGKHLHLEIFDKELNQLVNPLLLLPALEDKQAPFLKSLYLVKNGEQTALKRWQFIGAGTYELQLEVYDQSQFVRYFCPMAPYSISVFLNGEETFSLQYDSLKDVQGEIVLNGKSGLTLRKHYVADQDWLIRAGRLELKPGESNVEIVIKDYAGNERATPVYFSVKQQ